MLDVLRSIPPLVIKRLLLGAFGIAIVAGLVYGLTPRPIPVDTAVLDVGPLRVTVDEEGKTRIKDVYTVSAPIAGKVLRSLLEAGDEVVKEKTVIAAILPSAPPFLDIRSRHETEARVDAAKAAVALATAELDQARSELSFAERDLTRAQVLAKKETIAERLLEKAHLDVEVGRASVQKAEANLEVRRRELESVRALLIAPSDPGVAGGDLSCCFEVYSPVNGRVLTVIQKSEQTVAMGTPLVEIGDPTDIEIVVEMLSSDAVKVTAGAPALVEGWGGTTLSARVERVEPAGFTKVSALGIEEQRVRVILTFEGLSPQATALGHEFRVFVRITVLEKAHAVRVPLGALFRRGGSWAVFVVEGGRAKARLIELGARNTQHAEVVRGLTAGERIILHPSDRIDEGVKVTERSTSGLVN